MSPIAAILAWVRASIICSFPLPMSALAASTAAPSSAMGNIDTRPAGVADVPVLDKEVKTSDDL